MPALATPCQPSSRALTRPRAPSRTYRFEGPQVAVRVADLRPDVDDRAGADRDANGEGRGARLGFDFEADGTAGGEDVGGGKDGPGGRTAPMVAVAAAAAAAVGQGFEEVLAGVEADCMPPIRSSGSRLNGLRVRPTLPLTRLLTHKKTRLGMRPRYQSWCARKWVRKEHSLYLAAVCTVLSTVFFLLYPPAYPHNHFGTTHRPMLPQPLRTNKPPRDNLQS